MPRCPHCNQSIGTKADAMECIDCPAVMYASKIITGLILESKRLADMANQALTPSEN